VLAAVASTPLCPNCCVAGVSWSKVEPWDNNENNKMDQKRSRAMAIGQKTLKIYLIVSAIMFIGGVVGGVTLALAGYQLPGIN
jgi:hypothetical protein